MVRTYDPAKVDIIFNGVRITGIAKGTFLTVSRDNPAWASDAGSDGSGYRAKSNDKQATAVVTTHQTSPSNDALSALALLDEATGNGAGPLLVKDRSGRTLVFAATAWIEKYAEIEMSNVVTNRAWAIKTDNMDVLVGGNGSIV